MGFDNIIGKTIAKVTKMKHKKYDDTGFLKLEFTDGESCIIVADYGGYTGMSQDEYPTDISITYNDDIIQNITSYDEES